MELYWVELRMPGGYVEWRYDRVPSRGRRLLTDHGMYLAEAVRKLQDRDAYTVKLATPPSDFRNLAADLIAYAWNAISPSERRRRTYLP